MAAQAKLMKALQKKDDDDAPTPQLAPIVPSADRDTLKLKKSNLLGTVTWEAVDEKISLCNKHEFENLRVTVGKMFGNVISQPGEGKFRKIKISNPNFQAKVYSCAGAPELFTAAGFKQVTEEGVDFLVLPDAADVGRLQQGLDLLEAQVASRSESEEKKRKLQLEQAAKARDERAKKAQAEANPAAFDAAVASHSGAMADEDEAMVDAITEWMASHPDVAAGHAFDAYDIERQVPGPGGSVIASVVASAGIQYHDYVAHMKRSPSGAWSVSKMERAQ